MDKLLYGDFEEQYTDYETAEIAILPVPYDGTSTCLLYTSDAADE